MSSHFFSGEFLSAFSYYLIWYSHIIKRLFSILIFFSSHSFFFFWLVVLLQARILSLSKTLSLSSVPSTPLRRRRRNPHSLPEIFFRRRETPSSHPPTEPGCSNPFSFLSRSKSLHELKSLRLWLVTANETSGVSGSVKRNRSAKVFWHFEWE